MESISPGQNTSPNQQRIEPNVDNAQKGAEAPLHLNAEKTPEVAPSGPTVASSPVQAPRMPSLPAPVAATSTTQPVASDDTPLAANDDDVIEKEWVNKAKKIVAQTRHDPYEQEKAVSKLQADYVKKRYGKEIKLTGG